MNALQFEVCTEPNGMCEDIFQLYKDGKFEIGFLCPEGYQQQLRDILQFNEYQEVNSGEIVVETHEFMP